MIALAKRTIFVPSAVSTARVCGEANLPSPLTTTTLRWRARPVSPVVSRFTTLSFQLRTPPRSTLGAPNFTPCAPKSAASSITLATCSNAFEGMQPTLRQTPPSVLCRSTSTTFCPRSAARKAAVYPPGPDPSTSTSHSKSALAAGSGDGAGAFAAGGAAAAEGAGAFAAGGAAAAAPAQVASSDPSLTLSPILTLISPMTPASGAGTSRVALSLSKVRSTSSLATVWPGLTWISMIGTSLKSPISGSLISLAIKVRSASFKTPLIDSPPRSYGEGLGVGPRRYGEYSDVPGWPDRPTPDPSPQEAGRGIPASQQDAPHVLDRLT